VQVASDAVSVLQQVEPLLRLARPGDLERECRLLGEARGQGRVHGVEAGPVLGRPGKGKDALQAAAGSQRYHHRGAEAQPAEG
jgi:hypothetical protein